MGSPSEMKVNEAPLNASVSTSSDFVNSLERLIRYLNQFLAILAGVSMVIMMLLVVANVLMRMVSTPIVGITEMVGWLAAVTGSLALGYTQIHRGHVDMDIFVERFSTRVQRVIKGMMTLICLVFFSFLTFHFTRFAETTMESGVLSQTLGIAYYPMIFVVGLGFLALSLALLVEFIQIFRGGDVK